jgi:hypothetical protein
MATLARAPSVGPPASDRGVTMSTTRTCAAVCRGADPACNGALPRLLSGLLSARIKEESAGVELINKLDGVRKESMERRARERSSDVTEMA